jgi:hypothetical protein
MAKRKTLPQKPTGRGSTARRIANERPASRRAEASKVGGQLRLPRAAKGQRAQFYQDPAIDQLFGIAAAMAAELSVALERIHTLERVLARHEQLDRAELEAYEPGDAEAAERASAREALIERIFQVLEVTDATR